MDNSYGVYVRIQNANGVLFSSNRETWVEVAQDLDMTFGEGYAAGLVASLKGEVKVAVKPAAPATPAPIVVATEEPMTAAEVEAAFAEDEAEDTAESQFDLCEICGHVKDKWNNPGISKRTGKKYPGFFGCPNFRNHPK